MTGRLWPNFVCDGTLRARRKEERTSIRPRTALEQLFVGKAGLVWNKKLSKEENWKRTKVHTRNLNEKRFDVTFESSVFNSARKQKPQVGVI